MDAMYLRINGEILYLWRAVDQYGVVLDILVQERRSGTATERFFKRLLVGLSYKPRRIVTDGLCSYGAAPTRNPARGAASHQPLLEQSCRELAPADTSSRKPDAAVQVARTGSALPVSARQDP
jgi:transposase-like protein